MPIKKTNKEFINEMKIARPDITVLGTYLNSKTPIKCQCKKCRYIWHPYPNNVLYNHSCPVCCNKIVVKGINDLWTTHPQIAKLLLNYDDGYKYTKGSEIKVDWKCPNCKNIIKNKAISLVCTYGLTCNSCSDGISYPEKFLFNLLTELNINFNTQYKFDWFKNKYYDIYIPSINTIIEINGDQHYNKGFSTCGGRTQKQEFYNDEIKYFSAIKNGINNYIVIDARYSNVEYLKNNIIRSQLSKIYDLSNVNWNSIDSESQKSKLIESCDLWNNDKNVKNIAEFYKLSTTTIRTYLTKGTQLGICNYNPKLQNITSGKISGLKVKNEYSKKVKCLTTNEIFNSISEAAILYHTYATSIIKCCKGFLKSSGKHPITKEKLIWEYIK